MGLACGLLLFRANCSIHWWLMQNQHFRPWNFSGSLRGLLTRPKLLRQRVNPVPEISTPDGSYFRQMHHSAYRKTQKMAFRLCCMPMSEQYPHTMQSEHMITKKSWGEYIFPSAITVAVYLLACPLPFCSELEHTLWKTNTNFGALHQCSPTKNWSLCSSLTTG